MKRINSVNVEVTNMTVEQERKVIDAAEMMLEFFKSNFFYDKIHETDFSKLRGASINCISRKFHFHTSVIYNLFMTGQEEWNGVLDYEIDLKITRYSRFWSKVKGYIIPMKPEIFVNSRYFDSGTPFSIGSNAAHEWSHTLGFRHSGDYLRESLPYLINDWWEEFWWEDFWKYRTSLPIEPTDYKKVCKRIWWTFWIKKVCKRVVKENIYEI